MSQPVPNCHVTNHLKRNKTDRSWSADVLVAQADAGVLDHRHRHRAADGTARCTLASARQRLGDDPHLWASTLFDELLDLGYERSYPTMTRQIRTRGLRPGREPCRPTKGRAVAVIEHPAGRETQWDWVELPPSAWGWGKTAHPLVGALSYSGRRRGPLYDSEDQPHLIDALDRVATALGGLTLDWRFDRDGRRQFPEHRAGPRVVRGGHAPPHPGAQVAR